MSTGDPFVDAMMPAVQGVFGAIGQGMANMIFGNPQEEARKRAERELAAQRAAEAARLRAEEEARRKEQEHNALMSALMPIPGSASGPGPALPTGPNPPAGTDSSAASAYGKGLLDAQQCYPANAFGYCAAAKPEAQQSCTEQYRAGFAVGDDHRERTMRAAYETGENAGQNGELNNGFNHPDAEGPCRNEWIQTYNRGYFQGKAARASR